MNAGTTLARSRWFAAVLGLGTFAAFVLLVELFIRVGLINRFIVPMPSEILQALPRVVAEENVGELDLSAGLTLERWNAVFLARLDAELLAAGSDDCVRHVRNWFCWH